MTFRARIEPSGLQLDVEPGETLFDAAHRQGWWWPTVCGGNAQCTRCAMVVRAGVEHLAPIGKDEREGLERVLWRDGERPGERLACQARCHGDVVVEKKGVRRA